MSDTETRESSLESINQWFQHMMDIKLNDTTAEKDVTAAARRFEEMGVIESEISRLKSKMIEEQGVNKQLRGSLESYIDDEDETLPQTQSYTADFSRVNYDTSLAWIESRQEENVEERLVQGARAMAMAIAWLTKFSFKPETGGLTSLMNLTLELNKEHRELDKEATIPPEEAVSALNTMLTQLGLTEDQVDLSFIHDTSYIMMRQQVMKKLGTAYLSPMLDSLLIALTNSDSAAVQFKDYTVDVDDMLRQVSHSLDVGVSMGVAVDPVLSPFGGLEKLNILNREYLAALNNKGTAFPVDLDFIDVVINTVSRYPLLIDTETNVQDKLTSTYEQLVKAYNLECVQGESVIEVKQPETLLSVMDNTLTALLSLIDAMRVRADIHNSLVTLFEGKIVLGKAYSVYLSGLAE